ncbi:MAG: hypothetical protein ACNYPH_04815 [Gammaproteobacteria bacterium WSBS_2016_MAG_OTU1]
MTTSSDNFKALVAMLNDSGKNDFAVETADTSLLAEGDALVQVQVRYQL